jgi:phosphohistidine phosphatase
VFTKVAVNSFTLLLMRHAEAESGPQEDPTRWLTDTGRKQAKMMGKWLKRQDEQPDLIIQSNMARSKETVERLTKRIDAPVVGSGAIDPDGKPDVAVAAIRDLAKKAKANVVLVVSHAPLVEEILAYLTGSLQSNLYHFAHAAIAHFELGPVKSGTLHWLVTPNVVARDEDEADKVTSDAQSVMEAAVSVAEATCALRLESIRVEEHLLEKPKHRIAGPQIQRIKAALQKRFRIQHRGVLKALKHNSALMFEASHPVVASAVVAALILPRKKTTNAVINGALGSAYAGGASSAADQLDSEPSDGGPLRDSLAVTLGMDQTTEQKLIDILEQGLGYSATVAAIGLIFGDAVDNRAEAAAITEVTGAWSAGASATAQVVVDEGADVEMHWDAEPDACDDCLENEALEWVSIDDQFPNGDEPPLHPNCRCELIYRRSPNAPDFTA